jgi:GR25 family glycosyltransferase involved in LPS biosynthesis
MIYKKQIIVFFIIIFILINIKKLNIKNLNIKKLNIKNLNIKKLNIKNLNIKKLNIEKFNNIHNKKYQKAYYINLNRHNDRREYMLKQFKHNNIEVKRFHAIDKNIIDQKFLNNLIKREKLVVKENMIKRKKEGSIACLLSHCSLWENIYNLNDNNLNDNNLNDNNLNHNNLNHNKYYLIFEDDCRILPNFNSKLDYYFDYIPKDADMVWLGYNKVKGEKINKHFYKPFVGFINGYNTQHHCYLINKKSIPKILEILFPIKSNFLNKDTVLRNNFDKFNAYFLEEKLAVQDMDEFPISERTGKRNG